MASRWLIDITPLKISRDYRLIFFGQMISTFGTMLTVVVVPWQVFQLTNSNLYVGLIGLVEFVPMFILAFIGGALADAIDRRKLLRIAEIAQVLTTGILLVNALLPEPQLWVIYIAVACHAGFTGLQRPAFESIVPLVVPKEYMSAVGALNSIRWSLGAIISFAISGAIIEQLGTVAAYLIDFISYGASLAAVFMIAAHPVPDGAEKPSMDTIKEGFRYAVSRQELLGTYLIDFVAMLFGMPKALFPALAVGFGTGSVGYFYASFAVGSLIASFTSGWTGNMRRHGLMITIAAAFWGVAIIFFGFSTDLWVGLTFLVAAGFFDMISGIFRGTIWNQTIPSHLRGRLASIEMISYMSGPLLGDFEAGVAAHYFGLKAAIVSGGVLCVLGCAVLAVLLPRFIAYNSADGVAHKQAAEAEYSKTL